MNAEALQGLQLDNVLREFIVEGFYLEGLQLSQVKYAAGEVLQPSLAQIQLLNGVLEVADPLRKVPELIL